MKSMTSPIRLSGASPRQSPAQKEEHRLVALIDKCHRTPDSIVELSVAERTLLKRRLKENQPQLRAVFNRHIRNTYSVNLQNDLKRYLQAGATDAKNIRERYIGRRADRFRLPSDYQRSCSNRQLIKSNYKQRAPSAAHPVLHCPSTNPFAKVTISNHPTKSSSTRHTLFESVKSRLEFKNQAKDCEIIERIESKPQRQTGADEASGMHTQSKHTLEKWNSGYCQIMSPEKKCEQFLSPAVLKTRLSQHDRQLEASSIDLRNCEDSMDSSFRILNELNHDFILELSRSECWSMQDELISVIDKLRQNYAEDIVRVFFGNRGRNLYREEFSATLSKFYDFIGHPVTPNCAHNFTQLMFKGNPALTPSSLGKALESFCPLKQTKSRTIFSAMNPQNQPTIKLQEVRLFFKKFSPEEQRNLLNLFDQESTVLGQFRELSYWDLYMMEDGRCWKELWPALTVHPLL